MPRVPRRHSDTSGVMAEASHMLTERTSMANDAVRRVEFPPKIRHLVAQRAGFRCSYPNCGQLTIGPVQDPNKAANTGIAAHIYSAAISGNGPRGTGGLSKAELRSAQNAIWLCGHHASLIDEHRGEDYPADRLHSYKTLHETRVAHELAGITTPFGWVDRVKMDSCPLFSGRTEIDFAKLNLVIGGNGVGKTALCEWIAAHSNPMYLERWEKIRVNWRRVSTEVHFYNPEPHSISVDFQANDYPRYALDGESTVASVDPVKVIFPASLRHDHQEEPDDLGLVAKAMNLHRYEVKALCDDLSANNDYFKRVYFEQSEEGCNMYVQTRTTTGDGPIPLWSLAGSERARLLMELGIIAANKLSAMGPTMLILDSDFWRLDTDWLRRYAEDLGSPRCKFQTIASTPATEINFDDLTWAGWKIIRLEGKPPDASITTGFGGM